MAQTSVDSLLLDLEFFPHELRKIEEAYNKVNGILKGTFGTEAFIVGNFEFFLDFQKLLILHNTYIFYS